jgi:hypothetical protein
MNSKKHGSKENYEKFVVEAHEKLAAWVDTYPMGGMTVARNKHGQIIRIVFTNLFEGRGESGKLVMGDKKETRGEAEARVQAQGVANGLLEPAKENTKKKECVGCRENSKANKLKRMITGGAKLLKSELGIDASDLETIAKRRKVCESCKRYDFGICLECGCFCAAKVKLKSEACPINKWEAIEVTTNGN